MSRSPFHDGELEAQRRAGGGSSGAGIRDFMTDQHREFFAALPFVALATVDGGWPVATLLADRPGFVAAPDAHTLRVDTARDLSDPAMNALVPGIPAGVLGIDLATRRRNRANGIVTTVAPMGFTLTVRQSFGNCPQYIHVRDHEPGHTGIPITERLARLDAAARKAIMGADTFFVGSFAHAGELAGGVDISHRGGPPGFVDLDGDTLTIPDYAGNHYYNTLGNLVAHPRAALLFVDFAHGDLLHVAGSTEIDWQARSATVERVWRLHVRAAWRRRAAVTLRWHRRA